MNRYVPTMLRAIFILGALALTVLTLGASIAPAREDAQAHVAATTVAYTTAEEIAATEVAIVPAHIDVVGVRQPRTVFGAVRDFLLRKVQSS